MPKNVDEAEIADIIDIEGIGPKYAKELKKIGIKTTEDLRKASVEEMAERTKISTKLLHKWTVMADLFRVSHAAEEFTEALLEFGIGSVKDLSKQDPSSLYKKIIEFTEKAAKTPGWQGDVPRPPTKEDVEIWVKNAKKIKG